MRAIVTTGHGLAFADLPRPVLATPDQLLIRVEQVSLNRGQWSFPWAPDRAAGWDAYGRVVQASADGLGPPPGTRVSSWGFDGAWAHYRAVSRTNVAVVPAQVSDEVAAALPVAGLTAARALKALAVAPGQRLAVTGASGGVGHLLVQLALAEGLQVEAIVGSAQSLRWLQTHGDARLHIHTADAPAAPGLVLDAMVDTVGGPLLATLLPRLREGGSALLVGAASGAHVTIDTAALISRRQALRAFDDYGPAGAGLAELLQATQAGRLRPQVIDAGDWSALVDGQAATWPTRGKLTLRVPPA